MKSHIIAINIILCLAFSSCSPKQEKSLDHAAELSEHENTSIGTVAAIIDSAEAEGNSYESTENEEYEEENDEYEFKEEGGNSKDIIPENWEILSEAIGDLNGDGINDLAFFSRRSTKIDSENYGKSSPIVFAIYWGKDGGFTKHKL